MIKTPLSTVVGGAFWTPEATVIGGSAPNFDQFISKLFANNEQGFFYDPNDLSTMFQDSAGTIPVTAAGQPVGLLLDKSKGVALGNELVTNGSFDNGTTGWVAEYQSTLSNVGGKLRVTATGANPYGVQAISGLTVGKTYKLTYSPFVKTGTGVWVINLGNKPGGYQVQYGVVREPALAVGGSLIFTATTTVLNIALVGGVGTVVGDYADFDNISVKELSGNHAFQATSASRPILRKNTSTGANYLEFDGSDDRLTTKSFPAMGLATTIFAGTKANNTGTGAIVSKAVGGYIYQTHSQVVIQSVSNNISVPINGNTVITAKYVASGTGASLKVNNVLKTDQFITDRGYNNSDPVVIGAFNTSGLAPLLGHIYSLIGVSRVATDEESIVIEKEIAKRVGVPLNV